jgi:hypothetical protein
MNFWYNHTIVILRLPCLFHISNAVSSTMVLINAETSNSVSSCNYTRCTSASKCLHMELVPCINGYQMTWWQTIHMMPGLPVCSIPQWKSKCHNGECLELVQAIACYEPTFIDSDQGSNIMSQVRLIKSRIETFWFLEDITTSCNVVFMDWDSDMAIGSWSLCFLLETLSQVNW